MHLSRKAPAEYSYRLVRAPKKCAAGCRTLVTQPSAGHYYLDPMCDECFTAAAPKLAGAVFAKTHRSRGSSAEFSYKLVEAPAECAAGCGTTVSQRLAGHYYLKPLCDSCFSAEAAELAGRISALQPTTAIRALDPRSETSCANCGDRLSDRIAGHHLGDPLCVGCFGEHDQDQAALLMLHEAALKADASGNPDELLDVALSYAKAVKRPDAGDLRGSKATPGSDREDS